MNSQGIKQGLPCQLGLLDPRGEGREPGGQRSLVCRAQGERERAGGRKAVDVPPCFSECSPRTHGSCATRELISKSEVLCLIKLEKAGVGGAGGGCWDTHLIGTGRASPGSGCALSCPVTLSGAGCGVEWSSQALGPLSLGPRNLGWGPSRTFAAALPHSSN